MRSNQPCGVAALPLLLTFQLSDSSPPLTGTAVLMTSSLIVRSGADTKLRLASLLVSAVSAALYSATAPPASALTTTSNSPLPMAPTGQLKVNCRAR